MDSGGYQNTRERHQWRKFLIASGIVLPVVTYLWFFWFQTLMVIQTRYSYRNIPIASMVPVELSDHSVSSGTGTTLSYFGYQFEVPWQDVDTENIQGKTMVLIPFRSGLDILVGHGSTHDLKDTIIANTKVDSRHFRTAYGDAAAQSDYNFLRLTLNATPSEVRLFEPKEDVVRHSTLLLFKAMLVPGDTGIFQIRAKEFRGFQYGDPSKHPKKVTVALYTADGLLEVSFARQDGRPLTLSQADINRAIQTMRYNNPSTTAAQ
jgi:hypothetical protein